MNFGLGKNEYKGFTITIERDDDPLNPRKDFDPAGTMVCWHRRYTLGDIQPKCEPSEYTDSETGLTLKEIEEKGGIVLPLYMYDHSGITINTTGFNCPWDSGQIGYIYLTKETIDKEWGEKYKDTKEHTCSIKRKEVAKKYLLAEVEEYDIYLRGEVYGYTIEKIEFVDSCWGFYGDDFEENGLQDQVESAIEEELKREEEYNEQC